MNVSRTIVRNLMRSATKKSIPKEDIDPAYFKIKEHYKHFQLDNGLLVHQRGGIVDNILFMATITVNAIGLAMGLQFFYHAAYKL